MVGKEEDRGCYMEEKKNSVEIKCVGEENHGEIRTSVFTRGRRSFSLFLLPASVIELVAKRALKTV